MAIPNDVIKKVLALSPIDKAELIDELLRSLDHPDNKLDALWAKEAEQRLDAYDAGKLRAVSIDQVLSRYK